MAWTTVGAGNVGSFPFSTLKGDVIIQDGTGIPQLQIIAYKGTASVNPFILSQLGTGGGGGGGSERPSSGFLYPRGDG